MSGFIKALFAGFMTAALVGGALFVSAPAEARMTAKNKAILKHTRLQCKAQAEKLQPVMGWFERRKFVSNCVIDALKDRPDIDPNDLD